MSSDQDYLWYDSYTSVFTAPSLQVPWYAILGNHDYYGNPEAQIAYYKNHRDNRWYMPDHNYSVIYSIPTNNPQVNVTLELVCIDTALISIEENPVTAVGGEKYVPPERTAAYLRTVEAMLARSTATWLIVAGHYTIYSVADHGHNKVLIEHLVPLLRKYDVQAYFNGHDHVLQHIVSENISYFTSGHGTHKDNFPAGSYAAHLTNTSATDSAAFKFGANGPGFATAKATAREVTIQFMDRFGGVIYTTQLTNPRPTVDTTSGVDASGGLPQRTPIVWNDKLETDRDLSSWAVWLGILGCIFIALVLVLGRQILWKWAVIIRKLLCSKDNALSLFRIENGGAEDTQLSRGFVCSRWNDNRLNTVVMLLIGAILLIVLYILPDM